MVDNLAIGLSHALLAIALWRLLLRDDLDREVSPRQIWQEKHDAEARRSKAAGDA